MHNYKQNNTHNYKQNNTHKTTYTHTHVHAHAYMHMHASVFDPSLLSCCLCGGGCLCDGGCLCGGGCVCGGGFPFWWWFPFVVVVAFVMVVAFVVWPDKFMGEDGFDSPSYIPKVPTPLQLFVMLAGSFGKLELNVRWFTGWVTCLFLLVCVRCVRACVHRRAPTFCGSAN